MNERTQSSPNKILSLDVTIENTIIPDFLFWFVFLETHFRAGAHQSSHHIVFRSCATKSGLSYLSVPKWVHILPLAPRHNTAKFHLYHLGLSFEKYFISASYKQSMMPSMQNIVVNKTDTIPALLEFTL